MFGVWPRYHGYRHIKSEELQAIYNLTVFENSYLWLQRQVAKLGYNFEVRSVKPDSFPPLCRTGVSHSAK